MSGKDKKIDENENMLKWYHYLISLFFVAVGVVFIVYTRLDMTAISYFFGCVFAAAGIIAILTYIIRDVSSGYYRLDLVYGVMAGFAALLFYTKKDIVAQYFPVIIGCLLLGNGVIKLQHSIDMKRIDRKMKKVTEMWLVVMIFALMCIAAGFICVYLTPEKERTLFVFVGISLIVAGLTDIFTHMVFNKKVKVFRQESTEEPTDDTPENDAPEGSVLPDMPESVAQEDAPADIPEEPFAAQEVTEDAADQIP